MQQKYLFGAAALVALLFGSVGAASAAQPDGWYTAIDLGYHQPLEDSNQIGDRAKFKGDFAGFGRVGYRLAPNWRVELEGGYRADKLADYNHILGDHSGHINTESLMVNGLYDFLPDSRFQPFVGAGVGANRFDVNQTLSGPDYLSSHRSAVAFQGIAGLSWMVSDRTNVDLTYRYLQTGKYDISCSGSCAPNLHFNDFRDNSLTIGLRYSFAARSSTSNISSN